jgi:hypothetical protein
MVTMPLPSRFHAILPEGWRNLPHLELIGSAGPTHRWIADLGVTAPVSAVLEPLISGILDFIRDQPETAGQWVVIFDTADVRIIRGIASITANDASRLTARELVKSASAARLSDIGLDIWSRQAERVVIGANQAAIIHDLLTSSSSGGSAMGERFVGVLFSPTATVRLEIQSRDLSAFDDIVSVGTAILATVTFPEE